MPSPRVAHEGYIITGDPRFPAQKVILPEGKGSVVKELRGMFTSVQIAKDTIDLYLIAQERKKQEAAEASKQKRIRLKMEKPDATEANTASGDESVREGTDNGGKPT